MQSQIDRYKDLALVAERIEQKLSEGWFDTPRRIPTIQGEVAYDQADHACIMYTLQRLMDEGRVVRTHTDDDGYFHFHKTTPAEYAERAVLALVVDRWLDQPRTVREILAEAGHDAGGALDKLMNLCRTGEHGWESVGLIKRWTGRDGRGYYCTVRAEQAYRSGADHQRLPVDIRKRERQLAKHEALTFR